MTEVRTIELTEQDFNRMWGGDAVKCEFDGDNVWLVDYDYRNDVTDYGGEVTVITFDETQADRLRYGKTNVVATRNAEIYAIHHSDNPEPDPDVVAGFVAENTLYGKGMFVHLPQVS